MTMERDLIDPETGERFVVIPERRSGRGTLGPFSFWQWCVMAALVTCVVTSIVTAVLTERSTHNTTKLNRSICVQVVYLEGIRARDSAAQAKLNKLVRQLRQLNPSCPHARGPRPVGPGG
jgi:hypothetical protein